MPDRRRLLTLGAAALAAPTLLRIPRAAAQEVTLRLHHFLPAVSNVQRFFLNPWAQKIQAESGGRLRIQIFPSMQLGGAPPQLYDQARDGVADITWTLPGSTPGRFPWIEVFELPFVSHKRAIVNCKAVQEYADRHLREEFREVHPLCIWGHGEGLIHSRREVRSMEDLRGLKLRFPSRLNGEALRALGAAPVGMPVPQVPEALSQGGDRRRRGALGGGALHPSA
ncbi:TRAP transporter substrate-binding protein DctP [Siccirubricoccus sp. G192]|uniref:TRAP transporter substrate-binding protein DctP n=1 Tax=Siccirubricoccus sp. G192 TaxID=2849651 RepID=UPI0020C2AE58|nr:TRAP transporter substrate-binding protein DctP [Siccirubricoccus sp. G192]